MLQTHGPRPRLIGHGGYALQIFSITAIAARSVDGTFSFVEAPFEMSGYLFLLNTEDGPFQLR